MGSALDGTRTRGIDVSHWRPVKSWAALAAAPEAVSFIGVKATEGKLFTDPKLGWHRDGFRASSMDLCLYYHFAIPGDAREQAKRFVDVVGPLDPRERLCLDLERTPASKALALKWVDDFYSELCGGLCTDRRPFIYTSKNKWDEICGKDARWLLGMTDVDLWAKRYSTKAGLEPLLPAPWKDRGWHVWQFSDSIVPAHSIAGVGPCDGNVWAGDRANLRAYMDASLIVAQPPVT